MRCVLSGPAVADLPLSERTIENTMIPQVGDVFKLIAVSDCGSRMLEVVSVRDWPPGLRDGPTVTCVVCRVDAADPRPPMLPTYRPIRVMAVTLRPDGRRTWEISLTIPGTDRPTMVSFLSRGVVPFTMLDPIDGSPHTVVISPGTGPRFVEAWTGVKGEFNVYLDVDERG